MTEGYYDPAIEIKAKEHDAIEARIARIVARAKKEGTLTSLSRHFEPTKNERGKR